MSMIIVAVEKNVIAAAFLSVEEFTGAVEVAGSALPSLADTAKDAVSLTWSKIKRVVEESVKVPWESVQQSVQSVIDDIRTDLAVLSLEAADWYRNELMRRMREVISSTFDQILSSLRTEIKIGETVYKLKTLDLQQKLVFTGSIEASVTTLCKFVSSGELSVQGSYELVTAPGS